jgi:hypothetical protein
MLERIPIYLVTFPFGLLPFAFGLWHLTKEMKPRRWSRITGIIVSSRVERQQITIRGARGFVSIPLIEYEYSYKGELHRSTRRNISNYSSGNQTDASDSIRRYPVASSVTVLVNPSSPAQAVLEYGITPMSWIFMTLGIFILSISILMLIWP